MKKQANSSFELSINSIQNVIYCKNLEGRYIFCNDYFTTLAGVSSPNEIIGLTDEMLPWRQSSDLLHAHDLEVIQTGKRIQKEEAWHVADGTYVTMLTTRSPLYDDNNKLIGIVATSVDISARKKSEDALINEKKRAETYLENIIARMPGSIYWKDKYGVYLGCNNYVAKMAGVASPAEVIGKTDYEFPWRDEAESVLKTEREIIESGEARELEISGTLADGTEATFIATKVPLRDENGTIIGILSTSLDVTARKKAEQLKFENEAKKAQLLVQEELAHVSRLSSMGAVAVGIAHELNQPLASIRNFTGGAQRFLAKLPKDPTTTNIATALDRINEQVDRAGNVIHELKNFMRKDGEIKQEYCNVTRLIENVLTFVKYKANESSIKIDLKLDNTLPDIYVNKVQIEQVIVNLLNNAMDAINASDKTERLLTVSTKPYDNDKVCISIADTGIGMAPETQQKLFTAFMTTKAQGMGIGLSVCYNIVERHLGRIEVASELDKGTVFTVILPIKSGND
jgi:two-component system aerobic respiration control sensor histidine kinase ArcB